MKEYSNRLVTIKQRPDNLRIAVRVEFEGYLAEEYIDLIDLMQDPVWQDSLKREKEEIIRNLTRNICRDPFEENLIRFFIGGYLKEAIRQFCHLNKVNYR